MLILFPPCKTYETEIQEGFEIESWQHWFISHLGEQLLTFTVWQVIGVFSYMAYLFLNKDNDSTGGGGGGGDSGTSDDPVEEARRIMEKYK